MEIDLHICAVYLFYFNRGWIAKEDVFPFGNEATDVEMLSIAKKTRKPHRIKEVRLGYEYACGLIHKDPLPQLKTVFQKSYS